MAFIHYQDAFTPQGKPEPLSKIEFIPELNYWAGQIISKSPVYQDYKKIPINVSESEWKVDGTVIDLLLNYTFDSQSYSLHYKGNDIRLVDDPNITRRHGILAGRLNIWSCDSSATQTITHADSTSAGQGPVIIEDQDVSHSPCPGIPLRISTAYNIFSITEGEKDLLDLLFLHKTGTDISNALNLIDYQSLPSALSKLIYIYLNIEVNNNYYLYDTVTPLNEGDDRFLVSLYEKFVLDHLYKKVGYKTTIPAGPYFGESNYETSLERLTETNINDKCLTLPSNKQAISEEYIFLVHNGIYKTVKIDFVYIEDEDGYHISWNNLGLQNLLTVGDKIYLIWAYVIIETVTDDVCEEPN